MMVIDSSAKLHPWRFLHSLHVALPLESFLLPPELLPGYVTSGRDSWVLYVTSECHNTLEPPSSPRIEYFNKQIREKHTTWTIYLAGSESFHSEVRLSVRIGVPGEWTGTGPWSSEGCHRVLGREGANDPESQGQTLLIMALLAVSIQLVQASLSLRCFQLSQLTLQLFSRHYHHPISCTKKLRVRNPKNSLKNHWQVIDLQVQCVPVFVGHDSSQWPHL